MQVIGENETHYRVQCNKCYNRFEVSKQNFMVSSDKKMIRGNISCTCGNIKELSLQNKKHRLSPKLKFLIWFSGLVLSSFIILLAPDRDGGIGEFFIFPALYLSLSILIPLIKVAIQQSEEKAENKKREDELEIERKKRYNTLETAYNSILQNINIPREAKKIQITNSSYKTIDSAGEYYIWKQDELLFFFPILPLYKNVNKKNINENYYSIKSIRINDIEYYSTRGEIYRENKISGGGGGGSSVKGAVVGHMIAGEAGAIIGSRKKVNDIKSELITHDTREAFINIIETGKSRISIFLTYNDFQILKDILPEKEYSFVSQIKNTALLNKVKKEEQTKNITDQIREISKLKEEGILTEEEFQTKKQELLRKI